MSSEDGNPNVRSIYYAGPVRVALVVHEVGADLRRELADADLVLFGEAAPTGLVNDNDPAHDLPLGEAIPGPWLDDLGSPGCHVAFGLLEREADHLFDSAVLIGPDGSILLHYRRIHPGWHGPKADPEVYRQGSEIPVADTPFGSMAFLICGDLFDDELTDRVRALEVDWLLFPFWRCFDDFSHDDRRWREEELPVYAARVARTNTTTLMVNCLAPREMLGGAFGGAAVIGPGGEVLHTHPLGTPGSLVIDL